MSCLKYLVVWKNLSRWKILARQSTTVLEVTEEVTGVLDVATMCAIVKLTLNLIILSRFRRMFSGNAHVKIYFTMEICSSQPKNTGT